ncbi:MAG: hypothetical protein NTX50_31495 [Candidatus Sumerlaeota bacterium]|nr:hypothetical protein [Candidatus Sumerlaeota bacterium]
MLDDGSFCFIAWDGKKNKELWRSDGTTSGTRKVLKSDGASIFATGLEKANGTLFFCDNEAFGNLWKIDSQTKLAVMVKNIKVDISDSGRRYLKGVNELLYFSASDAAHGTEIWKSDGTEQGTVMVKDINSAPQSSSVPQVLTNCNGVLFFVAYNHITPGPKLYRSDGTERGTIMLLDTYVDSSTSAQPK